MKLIGITGKAGAGKTTFSNILAQKDNVGVIHIDDILRKIKLKYFKKLMKEDKQGEKTKVNSRLKTILYKNKILFRLFMKFRAKLIEQPLNQEIDKLKNEGKQIIVIDDIFLQYQKCYKEISLVFLMERPFIERRKSLMERDELTKEEVVSYDVAHVCGNYKEKIKEKRVIKLVNNNDKEDLIAVAEKVYNDNFVSIKERYKFETRNDENKQSVSETRIINREEEER